MKKITKKESKELCILVVILVVLFIFIGIMAVNEKKNPDTTSTESQTSEIQATDEKTTVEETSGEDISDDKNDDYILTVDNCKEFADLFVEQSDEALEQNIKSFVDKYQYRTVEFDGNIALIEKYKKPSIKKEVKYLDGYYDIIVDNGDYVKNEMKAFSFYFDGVCNYDLGLEDGYLPDIIKTGDNVHIVAKINKYDDYLNFLYLAPVSVTHR